MEEENKAPETEEEEDFGGDLEEEGDLSSEDLPDGESEESSASDSEEETEKDKEPEEGKKRQSRKDDKYYAELRRKNKALKEQVAKLEDEKQQAAFDVRKAAIPKSALDDLGLDGIKSEADLVMAEAYVEADENGASDPVKEAVKALRKYHEDKEAETEKQRKKAEEEAQETAQDKTDFIKKYGKRAFNEALKEDSLFMKVYGPRLTHNNLTALYEEYLQVFPDKAKESDEKKGEGKMPPTSANSTTAQAGQKRVEELSDEEFKAAWKQMTGEDI